MKLQYDGVEQIPVDLDTAWAFVTDPEKIGRCFPDVVEVTVQDATHLDAVVKVGVGPVRGRFKMKVQLLPDPSRHHIDMKISGGGFGSTVDLTAGADLADGGEKTTHLTWTGQAEARGPIAAVGGRVLESEARKVIEKAFGNIRQRLSAT